jgi:hypothetical protein
LDGVTKANADNVGRRLDLRRDEAPIPDHVYFPGQEMTVTGMLL